MRWRLSRRGWSRLTLGIAAPAAVVAVVVLPARPAGDRTVVTASAAAPADAGADVTVIAAPTATAVATTTASTTTTSTTTTLLPPDGAVAADRRLTEVDVIGGDIAPKSVLATQYGLFFAQNMMYRHTVTVYDRSFQLVTTISDAVDLPSFGHPELPGGHRGAPVEAAVTSDGSTVFVSNYEMYGPGLASGAGDACNDGEWPDSYVYRIPTDTLRIDAVIRVGAVPKYVAVTPDDRYLLVSNWCSFDVSVVDLATLQEVGRIEVGRHPRGIAVSPDGTTAYVAVMGAARVAVLDLVTMTEARRIETGTGPRHLVLSPDGLHLYLTLNGAGRVVKLDPATGAELGSVATGTAPRSMAISDDGSALYVVNYESNTMSKVRTADMAEIEEHPTGHHPIGVTYEAQSRQVWVANYSGTIQVFQDALDG